MKPIHHVTWDILRWAQRYDVEQFGPQKHLQVFIDSRMSKRRGNDDGHHLELEDAICETVSRQLRKIAAQIEYGTPYENDRDGMYCFGGWRHWGFEPDEVTALASKFGLQIDKRTGMLKISVSHHPNHPEFRFTARVMSEVWLTCPVRELEELRGAKP